MITTENTGTTARIAPVMISVVALVVTAVSVTFSISSGNMRPRVERLETQLPEVRETVVRIDERLKSLDEKMSDIKAALRVAE